MDVKTPHYLLFSHVDSQSDAGRWRFVLRNADGAAELEATDAEPGLARERLDLLTIVRALESLDQPSRVTLVQCSEYLWKGIYYGIPEWRNNGWRWEFFGQMVPVKNADLWQRLDRALRFHDMECRRRRFDTPHGCPHDDHRTKTSRKMDWAIREKLTDWLRYMGPLVSHACSKPLAALARVCRTRGPHSRWSRMVQTSRP